ncbi:DUF4389 domain-containing protein [Geodermatophilus normandii]|uniref:DUF4389 domain-containing protein n=1 Tax=Geodermatophilus normandii TaxID=1137989 RepID=A0A6P0GM89_9ACTN|nr:DUF4389 domain-containing protein [Geodermatophilus normandii]NEM08374.1 DUF4389 domain-containing protein [Geodermatophilus normandii]
MTETRTPHPVRVDGVLDTPLSRWLWLVKWLLLVPHVVVLVFLWIAWIGCTVAAFFAVLVTGRYPRPLFDFSVGVLRWTWRVQYYGYSALGTDRYPPFTLGEVPGYPASFCVSYPQRLSRGLVLVKWLLALPHYLVVALFIGGGVWVGTAGWGSDDVWDDGWAFGGLVPLLVLVAGVVLLFTGRYPAPVHDIVLGMDRWVLRVAAYTGLLTDTYPPFRLDLGGTDPGSGPAVSSPVAAPAGAVLTGTPAGSAAAPPSPYPVPGRWTAGRVVAVVVGALLLAASTGPLAAGGALLWADTTQREDGLLWSADADVTSDRYAVTTGDLALGGQGLDWVVDDLLGTVRLRATPADPDDELFVGVGRTADVARYLDGVGHSVLDEIGGDGVPSDAVTTRDVPGAAPATAPGEAGIWVTSAAGAGTRDLDWRPADGDWTLVLMRADGAAGVSAEVAVAAPVPGLTWISVLLLLAGVLLAGVGTALVVLGVYRAGTANPPPGGVPAAGPPPAPVLTGGPQRR